MATGEWRKAANATSKPNTPAPKLPPTMTTVTIGQPAKVENFAAIPVALAMGEFAKTNLKVKLVTDAGGSNAEPQELTQDDTHLRKPHRPHRRSTPSIPASTLST